MDFLGNQTRMNFPEIEWGMDFLGNQTGVAKKNNMIRLAPARIESGRGKQGLFRDSGLKATSEKGFLMPKSEKWVD